MMGLCEEENAIGDLLALSSIPIDDGLAVTSDSASFRLVAVSNSIQARTGPPNILGLAAG